MPAYNAGKYIRESIESVLSQDYNSFELLICDNCSQDDTPDILKTYRKHPRVRILRNNQDLMVGAARNKLLSSAFGKYISPYDADDIMLPGNLKRLSGFLDKHPAYNMVYADVLAIETRNDMILYAPSIVPRANKTFRWDIIENRVIHGGSMMRVDSVKKVGGYNELVYSVEDWDLWLKLAEIGEIKHLQGEVYYVWRRHPKTLSHSPQRIWRAESINIISEAIKRRYGVEFKG